MPHRQPNSGVAADAYQTGYLATEAGMGGVLHLRRSRRRRLHPLFFGPGLEDLPSRHAELGAQFPGAVLVGCSTGGEIIGDEVFDNSLVASAVQFDRTGIHVAKVEIEGDGSREVGRRLGAEFAQEDLRALFVLSDGTGINGSDLIRGLQDTLGSGITIT